MYLLRTPFLVGFVAGERGGSASKYKLRIQWIIRRVDCYQLFPTAVIGLQLNPTGTSRPLRSRPTREATAEAAALVEGTTLLQHWGELGATGGGGEPFGMAAARVCNKGQRLV